MNRAMKCCAYAVCAILCTATSQILPDAASLAGAWTIVNVESNAECNLELKVNNSGETTHEVAADASCASIGLSGIARWRAAPDGIALAHADDSLVAFFSNEGNGNYSTSRYVKPTFMLHRKA